MTYDHTELKKQFEEEYKNNDKAIDNWQFSSGETWSKFYANKKPAWYDYNQYRRNPETLPFCIANNKRHKHYDILVAFAEGKTITCMGRVFDQETILNSLKSDHLAELLTVAPDVKPDTIVRTHIDIKGTSFLNISPNAKFTFDGQTGNLKKVELV